MRITTTNYTIADYCLAMERKEIIVNRDYQRSDKVWPPAARSFFIETIIFGYPIPKLSLYQVTDIKSRKTYKEIVDGQQRSLTILDFYNDKLRLPKNDENPKTDGKLYSQLDEDLQKGFLDYSLSVDLFVSSTPDDIREVFKRINSYTVPLNPEEQRHSTYQGVFKWFLYRLTKRYAQIFVDIGVFGEKQLARMADAKLLSEVVHAILNGITTTNKAKLDQLYKNHDARLPEAQDLEERLEYGMNSVLGLEPIHSGPLMRPYNFYSLLLALCHMNRPLEKLLPDYGAPGHYVFNRDVALANLTSLADALENADRPGAFGDFVASTLSKTNIAEHRKTRFRWLCRALEPNLF